MRSGFVESADGVNFTAAENQTTTTIQEQTVTFCDQIITAYSSGTVTSEVINTKKKRQTISSKTHGVPRAPFSARTIKH